MAKRRRQRHRQARSTRESGGFLRGLALGIAVAAGVQIYHAGLPDWFVGSEDGPTPDASRIEPSKTNFGFYRLLPRKEVRIDESDLPGAGPSASGQTANRPTTSAAEGRDTAGTPKARLPGSSSGSGPAPGPGLREFRVQVGSFRVRREADQLRAELALGGFESSIQTASTADGTWHRVMLGPFRGRAAAEAAKARVRTARGIDARIVPEKS